MNHRTLIVGFTGAAGSGKDTAAALLAEALQARGRRTERMAFADPLRWMLAALGVSEQDLTDRTRKEHPLPAFGHSSPRRMLQTLGTEWGRTHLGHDVWIKRLAMRLQTLKETGRRVDYLLVTDVRMANEAAWISQEKGWLLHVKRPGVMPVSSHTSEGQQLPCDMDIDNGHDLPALRARMAHVACVLMAAEALA